MYPAEYPRILISVAGLRFGVHCYGTDCEWSRAPHGSQRNRAARAVLTAHAVLTALIVVTVLIVLTVLTAHSVLTVRSAHSTSFAAQGVRLPRPDLRRPEVYARIIICCNMPCALSVQHAVRIFNATCDTLRERWSWSVHDIMLRHTRDDCTRICHIAACSAHRCITSHRCAAAHRAHCRAFYSCAVGMLHRCPACRLRARARVPVLRQQAVRSHRQTREYFALAEY